MKFTKVTKKIAAIGGAVCLSLSILACPAATLPVQAAAPGAGTVQPQQDSIGWRYKIENGNELYRRLYNYSIGMWIGQWEFVGYIDP